MLRPPRGSLHPLPRLWIAGIASGAIWATHVVAYLAAAPDPHHRHSLLQSTGHAYWADLAPLVVGLFIAGLIGAVIEHATSSSGRMPSYLAVAARLTVLQVSGFLAIEIVERTAADGVSVTVLLHPVIGIGLALQVVAALLGALLLVSVGMAVDAFLHPARDGKRADPPVLFSVGRTAVVRHLVPSSGGLSLRAPPSAT